MDAEQTPAEGLVVESSDETFGRSVGGLVEVAVGGWVGLVIARPIDPWAGVVGMKVRIVVAGS